MTEIVSCPSCGRKLQVPTDYFGRTVQCPECQRQFTAQPPSSGVQTPASPQAPTTPRPRPRRELDDDIDDRPIRRRSRDDDDDFDRDRYLVPHRGGMILAFGILGFLVCIIFSPIAWAMGNSDLAQMRAGTMDPSGEGLTQAGRILGMIGSILLIVAFVFGCFLGFLGTLRH